MDTLIWIVLNAIGCAALIILGCGKKKKPSSEGTPNAATPTAAAAAPTASAVPDGQVPAREPSAKSIQKTEDAKSKLAKTEDPNKSKVNQNEKANTNEKIGATQDENEENPEEKKEKKEFKEPEQVKKADAKDPAYETLGGLDKDIFKK